MLTVSQSIAFNIFNIFLSSARQNTEVEMARGAIRQNNSMPTLFGPN